MTITDIVTILLSIVLILSGFNRGFLNSLLGPISLIIATILSIIYYKATNDVPKSLCIGLFGPFILGWFLRSCVNSWFSLSGAQGSPSLLSRIAGALLTLSWGMVMFIISVLLLAIIPPVNKPLDYLYRDIHNSHFYQLIKFLDAYAADKPTSQTDLNALSEDKRIQDVVNDPSIREAINKKDYSALMSNPKIAALIQDPTLMKKMLGAYRQMMQERMNSQNSN